MTHEPTCSDCGGAMEEGFVVDLTRISFIQAQWMSGKPQNQKSFGVDWNKILGVAVPNLEIDPYKLQPISARRCIECGVLKLYASKPNHAMPGNED